jgi:hypothetical protein
MVQMNHRFTFFNRKTLSPPKSGHIALDRVKRRNPTIVNLGAYKQDWPYLSGSTWATDRTKPQCTLQGVKVQAVDRIRQARGGQADK